MTSINRSTIFVAPLLALCGSQLVRPSPAMAVLPVGQPTLACPARATVANPNFAYLDISTGLAKWSTKLPTTVTGPVTSVPATILGSIPSSWTPNTAAAKWISAGGSQIVWVYSYRFDFNVAPCPKSYNCTVTVDAATAADDIGAINLDNKKLTPPGFFKAVGLTSFTANFANLTGPHSFSVNVQNAQIGPSGFYLSGKLRRQCF